MKFLVVLVALLAPYFSMAQSLTKSQAEIQPDSKFNPYALYYKRAFKQTGEIPANAFIAPESLDVDVLAFGAEYYFTNKHSVRLTGSYVENHIILKGYKTIDSTTKGLSDTRLDYLYGFNNNLKIGLGVSAPTGSIDEKQKGHLISYPGQLGSGTYDFIPQIEGRYKWGNFSLRPRAWVTIRTGRNDQDYRLGNEFRAVVNGRYNLNKYIAVTANLHYKDWDAVVGSQPRGGSASGQQKRQGPPPEFIHQARGSERPKMDHSTHRPQQRPQSTTGQRPTRTGPPSNNPFANTDMSDPFAAAGTRWGANMGLATGLYLGAGYIFAVEAGAPVYYDQDSELEGLEVDWYATGFITKRF